MYDCPLHKATVAHSSVADSDLLWYDTVSIGYYLLPCRGVFASIFSVQVA